MDTRLHAGLLHQWNNRVRIEYKRIGCPRSLRVESFSGLSFSPVTLDETEIELGRRPAERLQQI